MHEGHRELASIGRRRTPVEEPGVAAEAPATVPVMLITAAEVAGILGLGVQTVYQYASDGILTRHAPGHVRRAYDQGEVEAYSLARVRPRRRGHHYWATVSEAAHALGITPGAARQMMIADRLPYVTAPDGRRYMRRHQLEVIANVHESRTIEDSVGKAIR